MNALAEMLGVSSDSIVIAGVFLLAAAFVWKFGRNRGILLLVSVYAAAIFAYVLGPLTIITDSLGAYAYPALFAVTLGAFYWLLKRAFGLALESGNRRVMTAAILGATISIALITVSYVAVPLGDIYDFGTTIDGVFSAEAYGRWLFLLPLVSLFFI
ncbi:hypothetical protein COU17_00205 [Candidatus Kaiserbacteria bacterium CG10_big_fil_rev_8_21_14_0_10_49_17]|uniref:Uncharacterized protein n=1 Tax=Candidatus Kaiserbacteria bacterium CG10_big_fil_rev_8_21_14_0_10_49_17 TaxID=1974609 RepID=A0A2M6WF53_9BACT|nr:MAG: hypothetical protein COU17_00205 [Candidatus Kaiserbacteria bacterium CG10_big_fil_rev_8_21_14_0_10_49_17]